MKERVTVSDLAQIAGAIIGIIILAACTGCEESDGEGQGFVAQGDSELIAVANEVAPQIKAYFDVEMDFAVTLQYGSTSWIQGSSITIQSGLSDGAKREHVRHELTHAVCARTVYEMGDGIEGHPQFINGAEVGGLVPSWKPW